MGPLRFAAKLQSKKLLPLIFFIFPVKIQTQMCLPAIPSPTLLLTSYCSPSKLSSGFYSLWDAFLNSSPLYLITSNCSYLKKALVTLFSIITCLKTVMDDLCVKYFISETIFLNSHVKISLVVQMADFYK